MSIAAIVLNLCSIPEVPKEDLKSLGTVNKMYKECQQSTLMARLAPV